ncbi:hypothetical protein BGZ61DRAFT_511865 [Ilyonectria robusta]|uniref:uncharacterized protein n=1 Tax=Ilyonectria robusta TaxID=1079257 RepID=UPI001E8EE9FA|nr:uncharacterized protein BGZ61DRAFT_511865 [Ilyonectria robusta]KAH8737222.1 hypothetical protein BGZ61DRAFT_511865 [Ilyonectria robusta]
MAGAVAGVGVLVGVVSQAARGNDVVSEASEEEGAEDQQWRRQAEWEKVRGRAGEQGREEEHPQMPYYSRVRREIEDGFEGHIGRLAENPFSSLGHIGTVFA